VEDAEAWSDAMTAPKKDKTVVVAWVDELHREGAIHLDPRAAMWVNVGSTADVRKAKEYAKKEAARASASHLDSYPSRYFRVFVYDTDEQEPLARARKDVADYAWKMEVKGFRSKKPRHMWTR
jgi:hypothetical protein